MTSPSPLIFDPSLLRSRLERARRRRPADFLLVRAAEDLVERLETVSRHFVAVADVGTPGPHLVQALKRHDPEVRPIRISPLPGEADVVADLEALPIAPESLDLVVSALALQSVNDLPGALVQIRRALKPDGLFLAALLGGRTLQELRTCLSEAEMELTGGVSPRVAPFADVRDMGGLLQRAGLALPVADSDTLTVRYATLFHLMADLRAMGATNPLVDRLRRPSSRALFGRAAAVYADRFADADGRIRATFEIVSISGWAPHESQQKPARRGSGTVSLAAVLGHRT